MCVPSENWGRRGTQGPCCSAGAELPLRVELTIPLTAPSGGRRDWTAQLTLQNTSRVELEGNTQSAHNEWYARAQHRSGRLGTRHLLRGNGDGFHSLPAREAKVVESDETAFERSHGNDYKAHLNAFLNVTCQVKGQNAVFPRLGTWTVMQFSALLTQTRPKVW